MNRASTEFSDGLEAWDLDPGTIYLNHGSFGPPPRSVRVARQAFQDAMDRQPMDFLVRQYESHWFHARRVLARFIESDVDDLALVPNATYAMNVVADSLRLAAPDRVVLTNHEYGAVRRIWERATERAGCDPPLTIRLPDRIESSEQVVAALEAQLPAHTRLLVVSHITSPTAIILPVREIAEMARRRGVLLAIDGPHAPAQVDVSLRQIAPDFYTASCHKWLSAPLGSGFLYVSPSHQDAIRPPILSWGRLRPRVPEAWFDEFIWTGTADASALFAIPAAIEFMEQFGLESFRRTTHELARYAGRQLLSRLGTRLPIPDSEQWYGSMLNIPLKPLDAPNLQRRLWEQAQIEIPVIDFEGKQSIRVSCHLYNSESDIESLISALESCGVLD